MNKTKVLTRDEIKPEFKWNSASIFPDNAAWEAAAGRLQDLIPQFEQYRGHLSEGPATLLQAISLYEDIVREVGKVYTYASVSHMVNTTDPNYARMQIKGYDLIGQITSASAFLDPELLQIGQDILNRWLEIEPGLKNFSHYIQNLFRKQAHVRSAEVEEMLGMLTTPFGCIFNTATALTDADFRFGDATATDGTHLPVTQGTVEEVLSSPDQEARRTAWQNYSDTYLGFKNTLASNLNASIQQSVFTARARRYPSTLEASLFENNIPVEVFHNLIQTFQKNLPIWHRYWAARRKALGLKTLHSYDVWAPLTTNPPSIPFPQAVEWICAGLAPMGEEYVQILRTGCTQDRWVDVYPSLGKSSMQFSSGSKDTFPFIIMNYVDNIFSMSTLAHELGHSMHSYYTWKTQPIYYSIYSIFVAEVASNFHQAMVRAHLLATITDPEFQINVIEEAMDNFHRYFFIMPILARFELEMHERAEKGGGLVADDMISRMAELFAEGYGSEVELDRERDGITWAKFSHLYRDYYVYQYATGISAANALSLRIRSGVPGAAEQYISFLKAGDSLYPLDALKLAGVDMTRPQPVEDAFEVLESLVRRLENLVEKR